MALVSINPTSGMTLKEYNEWTDVEVSDVVGHVHDTWLDWKGTPFAERAKQMRAIAALLRDRKENLGRIITMEMGKPIKEAKAEIDKCALACNYFADHAETFLSVDTIESDAAKSYVRFDPLGLILAIMPWNFPFWQVLRFAAPALMAGNGVILKHASNTTGVALVIEGLFEDAAFPKDLFRTLLISSKAVPSVIQDTRVAAITLTGSVAAGKAVAKLAGYALKKTVLELGAQIRS
jgi:succinate-semialdehyde dehydrogenase/glutarate-semialdehyde dehydrogenase